MNKIILCRTNDKKPTTIFLAPLSDEAEIIIDESDYYDAGFTVIPKKDIFFYGHLDLTNDEDLEIIIRKNFVDEDLRESWIPTDFNHKTGDGHNKLKYPTADQIKWFEYCHCRIGKPDKVIAYRYRPK